MQDQIQDRAQLMAVIGAGPVGLAIAKGRRGKLLMPLLLGKEKRLRKKLKTQTATQPNLHWLTQANPDLHVY